MEISKEDFEHQFAETLDTLLHHLADNSDVGLGEFYTMTCIVENLSFFSPVIYGLLQRPKH